MAQQERYECMFCPLRGSRKEIRGHVFQHFTSQILKDYPFLRKTPHHCPKCDGEKEWRDRSSLIRHFALTHNVLYEYCDRKDAYGRPYTKNKRVDMKKKRNFDIENSFVRKYRKNDR